LLPPPNHKRKPQSPIQLEIQKLKILPNVNASKKNPFNLFEINHLMQNSSKEKLMQETLTLVGARPN
jgi:hypothetical protein